MKNQGLFKIYSVEQAVENLCLDFKQEGLSCMQMLNKDHLSRGDGGNYIVDEIAGKSLHRARKDWEVRPCNLLTFKE